MSGPGIIGIGKYWPERVIPNAYFSDPSEQGGLGLETSDAWIVQRTGIKRRHFAAPDQCASDLAVHAARAALEMAHRSAVELDQIIVATATPDHLFPPTANFVQAKLDSNHKPGSFDIGNVCNGGLAALELGFLMVQSGARSNAMVIGAEVFSRILDFTDKGTCILFGDCGAAVLIDNVENPGPFAFVMHSDGAGAQDVWFPGSAAAGVFPATPEHIAARQFFLKMNGRAVFKSAVTSMVSAAEEVLQKAGLTTENVRWLIPHQANDRIIEALAKRLNMEGRAISYVREMGNVSAASIFAAMHCAYEDGWLQKGDVILMAAVGSGYNSGAGVIRWDLPNPKPRPAEEFIVG